MHARTHSHTHTHTHTHNAPERVSEDVPSIEGVDGYPGVDRSSVATEHRVPVPEHHITLETHTHTHTHTHHTMSRDIPRHDTQFHHMTLHDIPMHDINTLTSHGAKLCTSHVNSNHQFNLHHMTYHHVT